MAQFPTPSEPVFLAPPPPRRKRPAWVWVLLALAVFLGVSCVGCLGVVTWLGMKGPDMTVYAGHEVPADYIATMRDVGALEPDEKIIWFYSDALFDIRDGFYFVSDRKVTTYMQDSYPPITNAAFDEIIEANLHRDTSIWFDSEIVLETDEWYIWMPVTSEQDGDLRFFKAIEDRIPE